MKDGRMRVVIERIRPAVDFGQFPIKRTVGETVEVTANVFTDGHDLVNAHLLYRHEADQDWKSTPMTNINQDRWRGSFGIEKTGSYRYTVEGWIDHFATWQEDLKKRIKAGQDVTVDLQIGAALVKRAVEVAKGADRELLNEIAAQLARQSKGSTATLQATDTQLRDLMNEYGLRDWISTCDREFSVTVDPPLAKFSSWYELFPRSFGSKPGEHGTFAACYTRLEEIGEMGFDIVYLPPIHPIGETKRKGKNNSPSADKGDPGSPWAIGAKEGGHKAIHPKLGTEKDFKDLIDRTHALNMEIAIDIAFQCSLDHPYIKEHPEWFVWRPDNTIQYAENPPKKYEDVVPFNFETDNWKELWDELKSVVLHWAKIGVRIFRVDNPHTKPFAFWEWLIAEVRREYPDTVFLAEAFTRPNVKYRLAKIGFTQSYTYFTWRNTKQEIVDYMDELTGTDVREFFRPNFWPNTPDILPEFLQFGGRPAFVIRTVLAATLASNYGVYGPALELCEDDAVPGTEEYLNSEKYEIKDWELGKPGNLREFMTRLNEIRKNNPALQETNNVTFHDVSNDNLLFYVKKTADLSNVLFIAVNLDPFHTQSGTVHVPLAELGLSNKQTYLIHDLLSDDKYIWQGERNYVELDPKRSPIHIFRVHSRMRREHDFDYYY